ncbi:hypothetical protein CJ255_16445 [Candidatus Viridilinea mediisalina]|uniref:DUF11 domain-containing protein n=1 Tax=Candidatus Viridilinea mediisalina TaxID=2024553 RepID=A0A2A6RFQ6_9CHLR|nr:hypothetical protein CJ255_16445 [Candidatus Viridilinea mediisalina]
MVPPAVAPTQAVPTPEASPEAEATTAPTVISGMAREGDLFFRMASDWGSAYPGQQVNYTLVLRNTHGGAASGSLSGQKVFFLPVADNAVLVSQVSQDATMRNLALRVVMPDNLEVLDARADRGADPSLNGQEIVQRLEQLAPGEGVELTIATRIRPNVAAGTLLVAQGQLLYDGLAQALFSNIVSVQVVGSLQPTVGQLVTGVPATDPSPTATAATAVATESPEPTDTVAEPVAAGASPTPTTATVTATTATAEPVAAAGEPPTAAPLPDTRTGVPFLGILLLGMTLFTRTWRLHRARERI